jgi:hypothetical protein
MNSNTNVGLSRRGLYVSIVLVLLAAAAVFTFLWFVTGGFFIAVPVVVVIIAVLAFFHYLVWGWTMTSHQLAVYPHRRIESVPAAFPDTFNLPLDDRERAELLSLLDRSLTAAPASAGSANASPVAENPAGRDVLRGVRDRLQRFGA